MIIALSTIGGLYFLIMAWILIGNQKLPTIVSKPSIPTTKFSIVIPFRNEAENLPRLLSSLMTLKYPRELMEVLLVDDASEDNSVEIIEKFFSITSIKETTHPSLTWHILQNKRTSASPKKDAITLAVSKANYSWILTTDADCQLPNSWLQAYNQLIQDKKPKMICGPVLYDSGKGVLQNYQLLDGLSLQGATMGSFGWKAHFLCNGANLGYEKSVFEMLNGFFGNDHIASGDDVFLLQKMVQKFPEEISYLKNVDAVVATQTEHGWRALISQRIRWASKTSKQRLLFPKLIGAIIFTGNVAFVIALFGLIVDPDRNLLYAAFLLQKIFMDLFVITTAANFFKKPFSVVFYLINAVVYPMITIWVVINSLSGSYQWKDRNFKK